MQNKEIEQTPIPPPEDAVIRDVSHAMPLRIVLGAVGGLLGAVIGGIVWGLIFQFTNYESGYVAWGIGLLCGWSVGFFSFNSRGIIFQAIAIVSSVFGILIGKYYILYITLKKIAEEDYGPTYAEDIKLFSMDVFSTFIEYFSDLFSLYDILFIGLAVYMAWRMLKVEN